MNNCCVILLIAFVLDYVTGDPNYALHPTRLIGKLILFLESLFEKAGMFTVFGGAAFAVAIILSISFLYMFADHVLSVLNIYAELIFNLFMLYSAIALKDMVKHADKVYSALNNNDLEQAKVKVSMIVGRRVENLDKTGIVMATIESMSENFVDGFFSVIFWFFAGIFIGYISHSEPLKFGVLFALVFRAINTLDSMVGYKNKRYADFGKFSAKLDDAANFFPARLAVFIICLASCFIKADCLSCFKIAKKDRLKHPSPNSAHAQSAVSGALNIKLGGETDYTYAKILKPFMGEAYDVPNSEHIKRCSRLLFVSAFCYMILAEAACYFFFDI